MADGRIKIEIEVDGKQVSLASKELDNLEKSSLESSKGVKAAERAMDNISESSAEASKSVKGVSSSLDEVSGEASEAASDLNKAKNETKGVGDESDKASNKTKKFAIAIGLIAIASAAFGVLKSSMDAAISRFDTLNKFPKVLQALGVSAEDSERAMNRLSDGIDGLPTKLDEIASTAQRMYNSFKDIDETTDTAIALNNALLGSGSTAEVAARGTDAYIKALQTGKIELDTWNTLQETMGIGITKIAEEMGFAGDSIEKDLYEAMKDGSVTMDQFNAKLIEIGTGTGIMAELAKENSLGIATSIGNLRNAAARGLANIIDSFNKLSLAVTDKDIAQNIDSLKVMVNSSFKVMQNVIEGTTPYVKGFASTVNATIPVVEALSPAVIGLAVAYGSYVVITRATAAIEASNKVLLIAQASQKALTVATQAQMAAQIASTNATKADIVVTAAQTGVVKLSTLAIGVLTGKIKLSTAAKAVGTTASYAFGAAIRFLLGPVGLVITGVGLLTTGVIALVKWFKRSTEESKRLTKETDELVDSTDELKDNLNNTSEAYKENQKEIKNTARENQELAKKVEELAAKENKSAGEKEMLTRYVNQLNGSISDLNLTYDEEANALNMTSEELQARLDVMKETEKQIAAEERLAEIMREQNETQMQLDKVNALQEEWNQKVEEKAVKASEAKEKLKELDEQEQALTETLEGLSAQQIETEEQITTSTENITAAIEEGNLRQITSYEELKDHHKEAFDNMKSTYDDLKEVATDAFDKISTESKISLSEMIENMEHNQQALQEWGENQAKLMEWAAKEGHENFMTWVEQLGPDHAGELAMLVKNLESSNEDQRKELEKLATTYEKGAEVAGDSFKTSLGNEFDEAIDQMINFVDQSSKTLREQIKNADFESIGKDVTDGYVGGVERGTPDVEKATSKMAEKSIQATKATLDSNSPSKVFKGIGGDITDGMVLGLNTGTTKVIQAVNKLNKSVVDPFKNTRSEFNSIGKDAMSGLNQGLLAGRAQVLSTARSIANSVASTMKSALKIHSPSRLMRDDVGKWIPEGIALGIKENANSVYRELDSLSKNMIVTSTPEKALGTSKMAYTSAGNQIVDAMRSSKVNSINSNNLVSSVTQKAMELTLILGGREYSAFIEDVTRSQDRIKLTLAEFRG